MNEKRVYTFGNGKAEGNAQMREVLGGKGANLAEMNLIGVPFLQVSPLQQTLVMNIMKWVRKKSKNFFRTK